MRGIGPRRLCVAADMERYGRLDTPGQDAAQAELVRLLVEAAARSGLDRGEWARQAQGDQEFAVLPQSTPEEVVLTDFVGHLAACLRRRNTFVKTRNVMRLRLAVDSGVAVPAALGHAGPAPVAVARHLNAPQLRKVLAALPGADLGVVVSDRLYQDVVRSRIRGLDPELYARVHLSHKEFRGYGWIHVPGHSAEQLSTLLAGEKRRMHTPAVAATAADRSQYVHEGVAFQGDVTGDVNFGQSAGRRTLGGDR